jgi:hypothetical protein
MDKENKEDLKEAKKEETKKLEKEKIVKELEKKGTLSNG